MVPASPNPSSKSALTQLVSRFLLEVRFHISSADGPTLTGRHSPGLGFGGGFARKARQSWAAWEMR